MNEPLPHSGYIRGCPCGAEWIAATPLDDGPLCPSCAHAGIRPHRPMSEEDLALRERVAREWRPTPEQIADIMAPRPVRRRG